MEARTRLQAVADEMHASSTAASRLNLQLIRTNFRNIKSVLKEVDGQLPLKGVNGVLLDLGMSSMQVLVVKPYHFCLGMLSHKLFIACWG